MPVRPLGRSLRADGSIRADGPKINIHRLYRWIFIKANKLNLFDIDDVGIARFAVWIAARDDDPVTLLDEARFDRRPFGVIEQDVHRGELFRQDGNDPP